MMKKSNNVAGFFVFASVSLLVLWCFANERNVFLLRPEGDITTGGIIGISIGNDFTDTVDKVAAKRNMHLLEVTAGGPCQGKTIGTDFQVATFIDESWRLGMICIVGKNDRVTEVIWQYTFIMSP